MPEAPATAATIHAGCVLVGPFGILLRGPSGSGKSALADVLVQQARARGRFAAFVSDDRTHLSKGVGAMLVARPAPVLAGLLEVRGLGILPVPHEPAAAVRLVVDLVDPAQIERLPEDHGREVLLEGVAVPRIEVAGNLPHEALRRIRWALLGLFPNSADYL